MSRMVESFLGLSPFKKQPACRTVPAGQPAPPGRPVRAGVVPAFHTMLPRRDARRQQANPRRALAAAFVAAMTLFLGPAPAQELPAPAEALRAHAAVRDWVLRWAVPDQAPEAMPTVWGASLTLRLDGRVIARSAAAGPDAVMETARSALREARPKMEVPNDALADDAFAALARRVTVSLELYARPVPIPASDLALPMAGCSPGAEALVVAAGQGADERVVISGVDAQLSRGVDPARELSALAAEMTGDGATALRPIGDLLADGLRFSRAPVVHTAMPFEGAAPVFLDRGGRRVAPTEIRTDTIRALANGVAAHLRARRWPGVERYGLAGDLRLATGAPSPMVAPPFEQALAAYALARHAAQGGPAGAASADAALAVLRDLASVEPAEDNPWASPVSAAMTTAALAAINAEARAADPALTALQARVLDALRRAYDPAPQAFAPDLPPAAQGLVAWAHVHAASLDPSFTRARAESAVRAAFRNTPQPQLVAQTPFLVWAELALNPAGDLPSAAALDGMRSMVWDHQLTRPDLRAVDQDFAGGIVFTRGPSVLPTWHTMRPLAALASMLGDERLTPGTAVDGRAPGELVRLTDGLRFVRQLALTDEALFLARHPGAAEWGVRPALWEPTASVEAAAMALLTACETLDAMRAVAARSSAAQPDRPQ